jgi:tetratricopeptide (TPR) repeat protein
MELKEKLGDQLGIATTLKQIALINRVKGEYDESLHKYNQSLDIEKKLGDQRGMADTLAKMGILHAVLNKKDKAIEYTQKALEIFEKIGLENDAKKAKALIEEIRNSGS